MTSPSKPRRLGLYIPWALFALFCAGWSGYWFMAKEQALRTLDAQVARANAAGLEASYDSVRASGFPLRLTLTIERLRVTPLPLWSLAANEVAVSVNLSNPRHLIIGLGNELGWISPSGVNHIMQAKQAQLSVRLSGDGRLVRVSLDITGANIKHLVKWAGSPPTTVEHLLAHVRPDPRRDADAQIVLVTKNWTGPTPFAALNDLAPFEHFNAAMVVTESATLATRNPLRSWKGALRVERFDVGYAGTQVVGDGELKLDASHRPEGTLRLTPAGAQPVALQATSGWWTFAGLRVAQAKPLYSSAD
jgi:hypothetical protein